MEQVYDDELFSLVIDEVREEIARLLSKSYRVSDIVEAISIKNGLEKYQKHDESSLVWKFGVMIHALIDSCGEEDCNEPGCQCIQDRGEFITRVRNKLIQLYC